MGSRVIKRVFEALSTPISFIFEQIILPLHAAQFFDVFLVNSDDTGQSFAQEWNNTQCSNIDVSCAHRESRLDAPLVGLEAELRGQGRVWHEFPEVPGCETSPRTRPDLLKKSTPGAERGEPETVWAVAFGRGAVPEKRAEARVFRWR